MGRCFLALGKVWWGCGCYALLNCYGDGLVLYWILGRNSGLGLGVILFSWGGFINDRWHKQLEMEWIADHSFFFSNSQNHHPRRVSRQPSLSRVPYRPCRQPPYPRLESPPSRPPGRRAHADLSTAFTCRALTPTRYPHRRPRWKGS